MKRSPSTLRTSKELDDVDDASLSSVSLVAVMVFLLSQYQHKLCGLVCKYVTGRIPYIADLHRHRTVVKLTAEKVSDITDCIHRGTYIVGYSVVEYDQGVERRTANMGTVGKTRRGKRFGKDHEEEFITLHKLSDILQYLSVITIKITSNPREKRQLYTMEVVSTSSSVFPCWVPFGFIGAILCCWVPCSDCGANKHYINLILRLIEDSHKVRIINRNTHDFEISKSGLHRSSLFFVVYIILPVSLIMGLLLRVGG